MPTSLGKKLQIKPGISLSVFHPPDNYLAFLEIELGKIPIDLGSTNGLPASTLLLFVNTLAEITHYAPDCIHGLKTDGLFWIAYPKGSSGFKTDVNRDRLAAALTPFGWHPVRQVALDDTWSAIRFRTMEKVG